jgi:hypothetical protein
MSALFSKDVVHLSNNLVLKCQSCNWLGLLRTIWVKIHVYIFSNFFSLVQNRVQNRVQISDQIWKFPTNLHLVELFWSISTVISGSAEQSFTKLVTHIFIHSYWAFSVIHNIGKCSIRDELWIMLYLTCI